MSLEWRCACIHCTFTWVHTRMPSPHRWQIAIDLRMRSCFLWVSPSWCISSCTFCCTVSTNCSGIDIGSDLPRILFESVDKLFIVQCFDRTTLCLLTDKPWIPFVILDRQTEKVLFKSNNWIRLRLHRQSAFNLIEIVPFKWFCIFPISHDIYLKIFESTANSMYVVLRTHICQMPCILACDLIMWFCCKPNSQHKLSRNRTQFLRIHVVRYCGSVVSESIAFVKLHRRRSYSRYIFTHSWLTAQSHRGFRIIFRIVYHNYWFIFGSPKVINVPSE